MRVVAIGAGNLPFPERHVSRTLHLSAAQLMALEANLHLRLLDELTIPSQRLIKTEGGNVRLHDLVTRDTGQAPGLVCTSLPEQPVAFFMALQTLRIFSSAESFDSFPNRRMALTSPPPSA